MQEQDFELKSNSEPHYGYECKLEDNFSAKAIIGTNLLSLQKQQPKRTK